MAMKTVNVTLNFPTDLQPFVSIVSKYDMGLTLRAGYHVVDARSLLGLFSLNLSKPLTLEIDDSRVEPEEVSRLLADIKPFLA